MTANYHLDHSRSYGNVVVTMPDGVDYTGPLWLRRDGFFFVVYQNKAVRVICPDDKWIVGPVTDMPDVGCSYPQ